MRIECNVSCLLSVASKYSCWASSVISHLSALDQHSWFMVSLWMGRMFVSQDSVVLAQQNLSSSYLSLGAMPWISQVSVVEWHSQHSWMICFCGAALCFPDFFLAWPHIVFLIFLLQSSSLPIWSITRGAAFNVSFPLLWSNNLAPNWCSFRESLWSDLSVLIPAQPKFLYSIHTC